MVLDEKTYVDLAEKRVRSLKEKSRQGKKTKWITTSKIRNLLAMNADIYNEVLMAEEDLPDEIISRIEYLRVRFVYESGREPDVKKFAEETKIIDALKEINGSRKRFIIFTHYMEALVAYHRFYGGDDK